MAKIAVTPTIVLAEFVLFKKTISSTKVLLEFYDISPIKYHYRFLVLTLGTRLLCFGVCHLTGHGISCSIFRSGNSDGDRSRI